MLEGWKVWKAKGPKSDNSGFVSLFFVLFLTAVSGAVDPDNPPDTLRVTVDKSGEVWTLYLERYSVREADFELVLLGTGGTTQTTIKRFICRWPCRICKHRGFVGPQMEQCTQNKL